MRRMAILAVVITMAVIGGFTALCMYNAYIGVTIFVLFCLFLLLSALYTTRKNTTDENNISSKNSKIQLKDYKKTGVPKLLSQQSNYLIEQVESFSDEYQKITTEKRQYIKADIKIFYDKRKAKKEARLKKRWNPVWATIRCVLYIIVFSIIGITVIALEIIPENAIIISIVAISLYLTISQFSPLFAEYQGGVFVLCGGQLYCMPKSSMFFLHHIDKHSLYISGAQITWYNPNCRPDEAAYNRSTL